MYMCNVYSHRVCVCVCVFLMLGCDDGAVRMWSVSSGELLSAIRPGLPHLPPPQMCFTEILGGAGGRPSLILGKGDGLLVLRSSAWRWVDDHEHTDP